MAAIKEPSDLSTLGKRIAYVRGLRGLSQSELARRVKCKQPSLWAIETDDEEKRTKEPGAYLIAAIACELDTTWEFLMDGPTAGREIGASMQEAEVLAIFRAFDPQRQFALLEYARHLKSSQGGDADLIADESDTRAPVRQTRGKKGSAH